MNLILQGSLCAHLSILTDKRESRDKKLGEFQKVLRDFSKVLRDFLEKVAKPSFYSLKKRENTWMVAKEILTLSLYQWKIFHYKPLLKLPENESI